MKDLLMTLCFTMICFVGTAQGNDTIIYCEYPDEDAIPPFRLNELLHIILDSRGNDEIPKCFDIAGKFYYNVVVLDDGTVALLNLECVTESGVCLVSVEDLSKLEKWRPASKGGENCNQKIRARTYIHFQ